VVHIREPRPEAEPDDVRAVKGSTRLEAKRQRRREGRDTGRRRPPIISESEFLARREAVERVMAVRQQGDRTQIAVLEDGILVEHYVDRASQQSYVGNVYLGKVQNVLPSMEAAFVDIGKGRNAVLYAGEVNFDATGLEGVAKRIESALKSGQSIMVQVTKDPIGHKGARLTSQVSLPGRYLVYVPGAAMTGISRKLPDTERARLKQILKAVAPEQGGIIVRTAAEGASEEELSHDITRLVAQWQAIEKKAKSATAPELLYSEPDLTIRVVRDIFNEDFAKLVIASDSEWDLVDDYVRYVAPNLADRLERWSDDKDLFAAYRIDEQLAKGLERKVWLPSGGSLVIDTTEAMTVIDVNTGKFTGQGGNLEQTVTRNNLEAAEEIVRQLRLRDVGGIIVIDFIDMVLESNRDLVLRRLIECLARDRTKHQVAEVTSLGLVQMTRKRVGSGLLAAFSVPCEHCNGRGVLISTDLTELQHAHARDAQPASKTGQTRSRSARAKAIAQVAAKTMGPPSADATAEGTGVAAETADGSSAGTPDSAGAAEATAAADGSVAADGSAAPARRRSRRSAQRPAGPPDGAAPAGQSAPDQPPAAQPAAEQPAAEQPAAEQPAAEQPAAAQPAAAQPAADQGGNETF
jgi:ribonuclease E